MNDGLERLQELEARLESSWSDLEARGYRFGQVRERLSLRDLSGADRTEFLRAASEAQGTFLSELDRFLRVLHVFFIQQVVRELDRAMATMDAFYGRRRIRPVFRTYEKLKRLAARYQERTSVVSSHAQSSSRTIRNARPSRPVRLVRGSASPPTTRSARLANRSQTPGSTPARRSSPPQPNATATRTIASQSAVVTDVPSRESRRGSGSPAWI